MRPELPLLRGWSQHLSEILRTCRDRNPSMRPAFAEVDKQVHQLRPRYGADLKESPAPPRRRSELEHMKTKKSPDMHLAILLPLLPRECMPTFVFTRDDFIVSSCAADTTASFVEVGSAPSTDVSFVTAADLSSLLISLPG